MRHHQEPRKPRFCCFAQVAAGGHLHQICEACQPRKHMAAYRWVGNGCLPKERLALCKTFIAKAVGTLYTHRQHPYNLRPKLRSAQRLRPCPHVMTAR